MMQMKFNTNKTPIEIIKKVRSVVLILETFILVLIRSGTVIVGKNLMD